MKNGFEINITEADFKAKAIPEQDWILFQGVAMISRCIAEIEENGCEFARKRHKSNRIKIITAISAGMTGALGFIYIIYQMTCK